MKFRNQTVTTQSSEFRVYLSSIYPKPVGLRYSLAFNHNSEFRVYYTALAETKQANRLG